MSSSSNKFNQLPYNALSEICSFSANTPEFVVQSFGAINKRCREVITESKTKDVNEMWQHFYEEKFSFLNRRRSTVTSQSPTHHMFVQVANRHCVHFVPSNNDNNNEKQQSTTSTSTTRALKLGAVATKREMKAVNYDKYTTPVEVENCAEFRFKCPVLDSELRQTDELFENLPVLFCDICQKKVYQISTEEGLHSAASQQRCVSIATKTAKMFTQSQLYRNDTVNIGFVISGKNPYHQEFIHSLFRRLFLCPTTFHNDLTQSYSNVVVRKNFFMYEDSDTNPKFWKFHVVVVNNNNNNDNDNNECDEGDDENSPLSSKNSPAGGGFSFLFVFPGAKVGGKIGTPLNSLRKTGRVMDVDKKFFFKQEENNNDNNDNEVQDLLQWNKSIVNPELVAGFLLEVMRTKILTHPPDMSNVRGDVMLPPRRVIEKTQHVLGIHKTASYVLKKLNQEFENQTGCSINANINENEEDSEEGEKKDAACAAIAEKFNLFIKKKEPNDQS